MTLAPIILFTYNRLSHVKALMESLLKNEFANDSQLFIFSDGGKTPEDVAKVNEVRAYLHTIKGFRSVEIYESETNRGLANSVIHGVSSILEKYDRVIVLEDDLLLSPYFLRFMNETLEVYADEDKVGCVNGHIFDLKKYQPETFFIKHTDSHGWGTWRRAWHLFESDGNKLLAQLEARNLCKVFDFDGAYPFMKMLRGQITGRNNSWAIRWRASMLLNDKLSINAGKSLVLNNGADGSGTHCGSKEFFPTRMFSERPLVVKKEQPVETIEARNVMKRMYRWYNSKLHKGFVELLYRIRNL